MIPLELIKTFASTDEARWVLTQPRVIGDLIVATDGRAIIEVPVSEVEMGPIEVLEGNFPNYLEVFAPSYIGADWPPMPAPVVAERPKEETCYRCVGGRLGGIIAAVCRICGGTGSFTDFSKWTATYCDGLAAGLLVTRINTLPDLRWFRPMPTTVPNRPNPIPFAFGLAGRGVLMPLYPNGGR